MSQALWLSGCLCIIALLLGWEGWGANGVWRRRAAAVLGAAAPLALLLMAFHTDGFGDYRVMLHGLQLSGPELAARPLSLGGDPDSDDVALKGLPSGFVKVTAAQGDPANLSAIATQDISGPPVVVMLGGQIVGALRVSDGDSLCFADCAPGARWIRYDAARGAFAVPGEPPFPPLLRRYAVDRNFLLNQYPGLGWLPDSATLPIHWLPGKYDWKPTGRIYPLRDFGCPTVGACPLRAPGSAVRSFAFRRGGRAVMGGHGGDLFVVLLDPGSVLRTRMGCLRPTLLQQGGRTLVRQTFALDPAQLSKPEGLELLLAPVAIAQVLPSEATQIDEPASRIEPGARVTLRVQGGALVVASPSHAAPLAANEVTGPQASSGFTLGAGSAVQPGRPRAAFDTVGGEAAKGFQANVVVGTGPWLTVQTTTGNREARVGSIVTIGRGETEAGAADGQVRRELVEIDRFDMPWFLIALAGLWGALMLACAAPAALRAPTVWRLLTLVQFLLALRLLVSVEGGFIDPTQDWRDLLRDDSLAYVAAPMALALATLELGRVRIAALCAFLALVFGACLRQFGPPQPLTPMSVLTIAIYPGFVVLIWGVGTAVRRIRHEPAWLRDRPLRTAVIIAALLIVFRMVCLVLLGSKERISLVAHTVYYLPLALLCCALFFAVRNRTRSERGGWGHLFCFLALFGGVFAVVPFAASTIGFLLVFAWVPATWALWAEATAPRTPRQGWLDRGGWALPGLAALLLFGYLELAPHAHGDLKARIDAASSAKDPGPSVALLSELARNDQNALRSKYQTNPDAFLNAGVRQAGELQAEFGTLAIYTDTFGGRGYMVPSRLESLKPHMWDDVSAAHVMSPFGRVGAAVLLAALLVTALLHGGGPPATQTSPWAIWGVLCVWTLFAAGFYMVLANLLLVFYAGRNVYFLAAHSLSDLLEGVILVTIAALTSLRRDNREGAG